ncbi:acyl-CoA dehydrogenase family protein [Slackia isoflavoniconvertens]|uniref:acyl-CoA dehydrogenase family protein n=1 Tax=Slackia isoflavoniconvertens TaxID=572010 RepID=UPI002E770E10|nr:acyl-CoA dehydrogenase family protein [Slackia isoflavoniconvertens]
MERVLPFSEKHEKFRANFGKFLDAEAVPYYKEWCASHMVPHSFFEKMAQAGFMAVWIDKKYGGVGAGNDFLYTVIKAEEYSKRGLNSIFSRLSGDVIAPYINQNGSEEQRSEWLPKIARGEVVLGVCMTEPAHGSDLAHIETRAEDMGDYYLVNGEKTFISNGMVADALVVAVRTSDSPEKPYKGISLLIVDTSSEGVKREFIDRIGLQAQDTAHIYFNNVKVPKKNLIGEENRGFYILMQHLEAERIMAAYGSIGMVEHTLQLTRDYVKERQLFGKSLSSFQNTQYVLSKLWVRYTMAQNYLDQTLLKYMTGVDVNQDASMVKYYTSELAFESADQCVQLFGGYGICSNEEISRQFVDSRIVRFMGGTSETQLGVIAGSLGIK